MDGVLFYNWHTSCHTHISATILERLSVRFRFCDWVQTPYRNCEGWLPSRVIDSFAMKVSKTRNNACEMQSTCISRFVIISCRWRAKEEEEEESSSQEGGHKYSGRRCFWILYSPTEEDSIESWWSRRQWQWFRWDLEWPVVYWNLLLNTMSLDAMYPFIQASKNLLWKIRRRFPNTLFGVWNSVYVCHELLKFSLISNWRTITSCTSSFQDLLEFSMLVAFKLWVKIIQQYAYCCFSDCGIKKLNIRDLRKLDCRREACSWSLLWLEAFDCRQLSVETLSMMQFTGIICQRVGDVLLQRRTSPIQTWTWETTFISNIQKSFDVVWIFMQMALWLQILEKLSFTNVNKPR